MLVYRNFLHWEVRKRKKLKISNNKKKFEQKINKITKCFAKTIAFANLK